MILQGKPLNEQVLKLYIYFSHISHKIFFNETHDIASIGVC